MKNMMITFHIFFNFESGIMTHLFSSSIKSSSSSKLSILSMAGSWSDNCFSPSFMLFSVTFLRNWFFYMSYQMSPYYLLWSSNSSGSSFTGIFRGGITKSLPTSGFLSSGFCSWSLLWELLIVLCFSSSIIFGFWMLVSF